MDAFTGVFYNFFTVRFEGDFNVKQRKEKEKKLKNINFELGGVQQTSKKKIKGKYGFKENLWANKNKLNDVLYANKKKQSQWIEVLTQWLP